MVLDTDSPSTTANSLSEYSSHSNHEWTPLNKIGRGVVIGKHTPNPNRKHDIALNLGDEVYVFETHVSGAWYRGYVVSSPSAHAAFNQPLPRGTKINNAALKALDANIRTGIFPCTFVHLHEYFDLSKNDNKSNNLKDKFSVSGEGLEYDIESFNSGFKSKPPPIPALRLGNEVPTVPNEPLVDDIYSVIDEWYNTYVYHHYLFGNHELVNTINTIIQELFFIRRKLIYGLLTSNERILARKKVIWQIARVINMLNRGHVVRDTKNGDIVAGKEGPVRLAQEQILTALAPNYPDHSMINEVAVETTLPKHILVDFKSCIGQGYGHGLTVYLQLRTKSTRLTESFAIHIKPEMRLTDLSAVLFRDLPLSIERGDVILSAEVFEDVPLKSKSPTSMSTILGGHTSSTTSISTRPPKKQGRRGLASGAADISRLFRIEEKGESPFTIRMYATYFSASEPNKDNRGWGELFERINQDSESAIGMAKSLTTTSLTDDRNDVYITLGKISLNHVTNIIADFLLVSLSSSSGKTLFSNSSNTSPLTSWDSLATYNNEVVGEMICVNNFEKNESIYLSLYVGGEFIAQTNIPIWHGTKVWTGKRTVNFSRDSDVVATLNLSIEFVGNGFNTDVAIEKILHWRVVYDAHGVEELISTLSKFKVIESNEFVKRFYEIMDALLEMLSSFLKSDRSDLLLSIFHALVSALEKVTARNKDYLYLADDYVNNRFNFAGLSEILLTLMDQAIQIDIGPGRGHDSLLRLFKVSDYFSQLIAASASIDTDRGREAQQITMAALRKHMKRVTDSIKHVVSRQEKDFVELQMVVVQNVFHFYDNLRHYVAADDMLQMIIEMTDSIRNDNDKLNTQRLLLIKKLSSSWHYQQSKYRPHITAYTIKWTLPFWLDSREFTQERKDQIRLLSGIFAAQFGIIWPVKHKEPEVCKRYGQLLPVGAKIYNELLTQFESSGKKRSRQVFSPLFPDVYPFETRPIDSLVNNAVFDETLIELGIVLTLLVNISHFSGQQVIDHSLTTTQYSELAFNIIQACNAMLNSVSFPKLWISLLAVHHETVLGCLDYLSVLMKSRFIPLPENAEEFNSGLWFSFLTCLLHLAGSEAIAVEHLPEQKRKTVWKISGDIRGRAADLLREMWDAIGWHATDEDRNRFQLDIFGGFQVQMFGGETSLVRDVLNLCLVRHPAAQKAAVHVLHSMIVSEWTLNEDLTGLQREIIASLDDIFQSRAFLPEDYDRSSFSQLLRNSFHIDREDEVYPYITALIDDVEEFLDLLLDLYRVPPGDAYNDDRIFHALNVLNFLKDIDRVEIFARYVNDIAEWNRSKAHHVQTGLALRLLASAYEWSYEQKLEASEHPNFPPQTGFERKEALYEDIIQCFSRGKSFENAIDAVKELIFAYETIAFDFKKLANATRILAKLYESVDTVERLAPQYFRVAYIGVGFPRSLRNRLFIFEGSAWEKLESIHERLHKTYPGATIVSNEAAAKQDGQYLFVTTVEPDNEGKISFLNGVRPTAGAKEYQSRLDLRRFSFSRPLPGNTSPLDLWVEKTTYETFQAFPTVVKRSEVKNVSVIKLSPLENALQLLQAKIDDLVELEGNFKNGKSDQSSISRLDLILSGAVDSPVNGGIQLYRAFLEDDSLRADPSTSPLVHALENAFLDYASCIQRCLVIHGKVVPSTLRPLHLSLVELFSRNFAPELATLGEGISYEEQLRNGSLARRGSVNHNFNYAKPSSVSRNTSDRVEYDDEDESKANLDSLLGNAIAASDILIRGSDMRENRAANESRKRTTIIKKSRNDSTGRPMFN
ncbi:hypothetical protein DV451_000381 [Geotrichum candidum]|uniref:DOCKER domain-containing protein n=1 Tax=Geotrichum candidum TaxID=1173061 RepID=A0A9P5G8R1_GEOCN|nr:hypothetical protein DV451_000381 [Geotrichum candidum]KAF5111481.1 hypothetical protein DV453_000126 [Geotrichum candidum]